MAIIKVTPETLQSQGEELNRYAEDLAETLKNIEDKIKDITQGWEGLAEDAYFSMYEDMQKSLAEFPNMVNSLGDTTKSAAQAFARVDDDLKKAFNQ